MAASFSRMSLPSTGEKSFFTVRSEQTEQAHPPGARKTPAVSRLWLNRRYPPEARIVTELKFVDAISPSFESPQTKAPMWTALAWLPAAKARVKAVLK